MRDYKQRMYQGLSYVRQKCRDLVEALDESCKVEPIDTSATTGWSNRMLMLQQMKRGNYRR